MVCGSGATRFGQSISRGNQRIPEERRCLVQYVNCCGLLRPVIGEQLRSDHGGGALSSSKPHNHGTLLQLTRSYWQRSIIRTQQVRTTSNGPCHVLKTRTYTSTGPEHIYKDVRSARFFRVEYVGLVCSRVGILL